MTCEPAIPVDITSSMVGVSPGIIWALMAAPPAMAAPSPAWAGYRGSRPGLLAPLFPPDVPGYAATEAGRFPEIRAVPPEAQANSETRGLHF